MLKAIKTYCLRCKLSSSNSSTEAGGHKVGLLFNYDTEDKQALLEQIQLNYKVSKSEINVLGFSKKTFKKEGQPDDVFTLRDFSIFGKPKLTVMQDFLNEDYQLLFNYFGRGELGLEVLANLTNAKLKVGLKSADERINDVILDMKTESMAFFKESSTYIQHITR